MQLKKHSPKYSSFKFLQEAVRPPRPSKRVAAILANRKTEAAKPFSEKPGPERSGNQSYPPEA